MKSFRFREAGLRCVVLGCLALAACGRSEHPMVGLTAPEVKLPLLDGGTFTLSEHRGKDIVILDFWATWCSPCRASMPVIARVAKDYASKGVVLYTINEAERDAEARAFLKSIAVTCNVAMDRQLEAGIAYEADFIPQTVIIDRSGRIQAIHVGSGFDLERALRRDLDKLVAGQDLL